MVFDGAEPARGLVVAVRGGRGHGSRVDERSDHVDFTLFLVVGNTGRETRGPVHAGAGTSGLPSRKPASSMAGVISMALIPSGLRYVGHASLMQFHCINSAIRFGLCRHSAGRVQLQCKSRRSLTFLLLRPRMRLEKDFGPGDYRPSDRRAARRSRSGAEIVYLELISALDSYEMLSRSCVRSLT